MSKVRQRTLLKSAARRWTPWESVAVTEAMRSEHPHLRHCAGIFRNSRYEVQMFHCDSVIGGVVQATIVRHGDLEEMTWEELQRILRERFGPDAVAVEIYPKTADEWHVHTRVRVLWILPAGYQLPFGLEQPASWGRQVT